MACLKKYPDLVSRPRNNHYNACFTLWQGESMKEVRKVFMEGFQGLSMNGDTYALYTYVVWSKYQYSLNFRAVCMVPVCFADRVDEVESALASILITLRNMKSLNQNLVDCFAMIVDCFKVLRLGMLVKDNPNGIFRSC